MKKLFFSIYIFSVIALTACGQNTDQAINQDTSEIISYKAAVIDSNTLPGVDGAQIAFVFEDNLIFYDYFGLFVYDLTSLKLQTSLDLQYIGCSEIQGDSAVSFYPEPIDYRILIHANNTEWMYEFDFENEVVRKMSYDENLCHSASGLVDIRKVLQESDPTIFQSNHACKFTLDGQDFYVWLESGSGMPIDLSVHIRKTGADDNSDSVWYVFQDSLASLPDGDKQPKDLESENPLKGNSVSLLTEDGELFVLVNGQERREISDACSPAGTSFLFMNNDEEGYLLYCSDPAGGLMEKRLFQTNDAWKNFEVQDLTSVIQGYPTGILFTESGIGYMTVAHRGEPIYLYRCEKNGGWLPYSVDVGETGYSYIDGESADRIDGKYVLRLKVVTEESESYIQMESDDGEQWELIRE
ncbi:MAG: hypothetical protein K5891_08490 [Lachnospiraceae bacterium]|nr:hypothetical protein [Lachnospiraceae bacterium]